MGADLHATIVDLVGSKVNLAAIAASDLLLANMQRWSDRAWVENELRTLLAPDFVRHDRRSVISMPSANAAEFIASALAGYDSWGQVSWHVEVLAVRRERLAASRLRIEAGLEEMEQIRVVQFNEALNQMELMIFFDHDDADAAVAELDRLHAEIEAMPK